MATDGHGPDDIAMALAEASTGGTGTEADSWTIRRDVWNSLADWANRRLLVQKAATGAWRPDDVINPAGKSHQGTTMAFSFALECGAFNGEFFTDSLAVISRIRSLLLPMEAKSQGAFSSRLEVVRDTPGYTLIMDGRVIQSRLGLSRVAPAVMACLTLNAADEGDIIVDAGLVTHPSDPGTAILVTSINPELGDLPALRMADRLETSFGRAGRIQGETAALYGLGLPAQAPYEAQGANSKARLGQHHLQDGRKVWLQPASLGLVRQSYQVNTVIIPTSDALDEKNGIRPVSVSEALCHLISGCSRYDGLPLDTAGFNRLANWLDSAERYLLDINNLDAALEVLAANPLTKQMSYQQNG
ncbi:hypothetical protein [Marinobacter salicampi]|uniref:hypothetical protein n=1 Tax=Marinobacter salicampi TaxID=435907 RepID=UPI001F5F263D|nr:hypothetical protein [Marinobacter salicampi]